MKNYVFLYHSDRTTPPSSESLAAWGEWFETLTHNLVDGGNPFNREKAVLKEGKVAREGDTVVGYSIVKAKDMDEAVALAKGSPLANAAGCEVRVYETGQM
jgi:hypothetical protein